MWHFGPSNEWSDLKSVVVLYTVFRNCILAFPSFLKLLWNRSWCPAWVYNGMPFWFRVPGSQWEAGSEGERLWKEMEGNAWPQSPSFRCGLDSWIGWHTCKCAAILIASQFNVTITLRCCLHLTLYWFKFGNHFQQICAVVWYFPFYIPCSCEYLLQLQVNIVVLFVNLFGSYIMY